METLTEEGRRRISESAKKQNANQWTKEFRNKHSKSMRRAVIENPDSYTKNNVCGRTKIIKYNGANLKGNWEVIVAKWLDTKGIIWETEVNPQPYFWEEKWHLYYPDFYLSDYNAYIEVKGYKTERDDAKWTHFSGSLSIIDCNVINDLDKYSITELLVTQRFTAP